MKRTDLIEKLLKEGFSEKTLNNFTDNQLKQLASRIISEEEDVMISKKDPQFQQKVAANKKLNKTIETYEELKGNQKVLDKNDNGEIDADDFAILNKEKKGDVEEGKYHDERSEKAFEKSKEDFPQLKNVKKCEECGKVESKCKCKKDEVNEADMGLTVKSTPKSTPLFGGVSKKSSTPKKKSATKKEEKTTEEGEMDESLHGIMIGATKEKLKKSLGRDPEDHEVEKELDKFVDSWKKDIESKKEGDKKEHGKKQEEDESKKPSEGLSKEKKSEVVKKAKKGGDIGKKGKGFEKLADKATKEYGSKEKGEKVAAASMWKNIKREGVEIKNWVKGLVENEEFHSFTSKNEIMELIQTKLNESETMVQHGPKVKKGHNNVPEFMTYDAIVDAEPKTAPSKPAPTTKPGTKPTPTRREDPRKTPFQPGPGPNPKPKAKIAEEKKK